MKHLGFTVPILLLMGVGIIIGLAAGQATTITVGQTLDRSVAVVGEPVTVTLTLTNEGYEASQVTVQAILPPGVVTDPPGMWVAELIPGTGSQIQYPVRATQSGIYQISSQISYTDAGMTRQLSMMGSFQANDIVQPGNKDMPPEGIAPLPGNQVAPDGQNGHTPPGDRVLPGGQDMPPEGTAPLPGDQTAPGSPGSARQDIKGDEKENQKRESE
jgi:uncharacterized repeat protein (TIGR01451 family)